MWITSRWPVQRAIVNHLKIRSRFVEFFVNSELICSLLTGLGSETFFKAQRKASKVEIDRNKWISLSSADEGLNPCRRVSQLLGLCSLSDVVAMPGLAAKPRAKLC